MRRVVVTGMGIVSPLGNDLTSFWQALLSSKSSVRKLTKDHLQDSEFLDIKIGGTVEITKNDMEKLNV